MFMSYYLTDMETQYKNSEREYLAVVKCFTKIKWLVANNPYEIFIYSDYRALQDIFSKNDSEKARINVWLDWFSEFDLRLVYWALKDQHIGLADGLSRMLTKLIDEPKMKDPPERLAMSTTISLKIQLTPLQILQYKKNCYLKYNLLIIYKKVVQYLQGRLESPQDLTSNKRKQIMKKVQNYSISHS